MKYINQPMQGQFFHWVGPDGDIENQGKILRISKTGATIQLFEWFFGLPSTIIKVKPDYLESCNFYSTVEAMDDAYERITKDEDD